MEKKIINLASNPTFSEEPDIDAMTAEQLKTYRDDLREQIVRLDAVEPAQEASEEYENWADRHEELEDLLDEVMDRLEELV